MTSLTLNEGTWRSMIEALEAEVETAGFLQCGYSSDHHTLYDRGLGWFEADDYDRRDAHELQVSSRVFVQDLATAAHQGTIPVFVHSHPGGSAMPSAKDRKVDASIMGAAQVRSHQGTYASFIIGGTPDQPRFTGHIYREGDKPVIIERLKIIGRRLQLLTSEEIPGEEIDLSQFDRHIRAFGEDGQSLLGRLRIGIVGVGGTGSAVAEQVARLGVAHITLIDDKKVTDKNLTRIHESRHADIDKPKVNVMRDAIVAIGMGTDVKALFGRVTSQVIMEQLTGLDVVFACTDDQRGRALLSRFALWHLTPVIDMGFVIDPSDSGMINGLFGRVTALKPGAACLRCREHVTPDAIRIESLTQEQRKALADEGYAPGLGDPDPSVGVFTTCISTFAANMLLEWLFGYAASAGTSTEVVLRLHDLAISRNSRAPSSGCFCATSENYGRGDIAPYLGVTWTT